MLKEENKVPQVAGNKHISPQGLLICLKKNRRKDSLCILFSKHKLNRFTILKLTSFLQKTHFFCVSMTTISNNILKKWIERDCISNNNCTDKKYFVDKQR